MAQTFSGDQDMLLTMMAVKSFLQVCALAFPLCTMTPCFCLSTSHSIPFVYNPLEWCQVILERKDTYRQHCALKMSMRPVECCCAGAPYSHPYKQVTTLEASASPRLLGSFWAVRAVTCWPSHLSIIQIAWETTEVLQTAKGRPSQHHGLTLCEMLQLSPLHQLDQDQETVQHTSLLQTTFFNKQKLIFGSIQWVRVPIIFF